MPTGAQLLTSSSEAVQGSTTEKTFCSRMRRAMSWVYCAPKSRMTMDSLSLDWGSTDEFLKSDGPCKGRGRTDVAQFAKFALVQAKRKGQICTAKFGTSLRIGSSRSIEVCGGEVGKGAEFARASGISAMQT